MNGEVKLTFSENLNIPIDFKAINEAILNVTIETGDKAL
jgi:hypothetical protein